MYWKGFYLAILLIIVGLLTIFGMLYPALTHMVNEQAERALLVLTFIPILFVVFGGIGVYVAMD